MTTVAVPEQARLESLTNVFVGIKPNIFGTPTEHITIEYLGNKPTKDSVKMAAADARKKFGEEPFEARVTGYAVWGSNGMYFRVALISFFDLKDNVMPISFTKNWHITLEKSTEPLVADVFDYDSDAYRTDMVDLHSTEGLKVGFTNDIGKFIMPYRQFSELYLR